MILVGAVGMLRVETEMRIRFGWFSGLLLEKEKDVRHCSGMSDLMLFSSMKSDKCNCDLSFLSMNRNLKRVGALS